jgi:putative effector of murein hydrolase LrgA (UPF0299 family)
MAEAERTPSTIAQSEASAEETQLSAPKPVECAGGPPESAEGSETSGPETSWKLKVPLLATLGATFGFLIGSGLYGEIHPKPGEEQNLREFLTIALIIGTAAYWFFDPIMELVHTWFGAPVPEFPKERRLAASLAVVITTLAISILHHSLGETLVRFHTKGFLTLLVLFAGTAGTTTYYWIRGAHKQPARSATYGARTGAIAGPVAGFLLVFLALQDKTVASQMSSHAALFAKGMGVWTFLTFVPGLLGGMAIEKAWDPKSPSRGILACLGAFSVVFLLCAWLVGLEFAEYRDTIWAIALQGLAQSLGWGLGLYLQREACDPIFSGAGAHATLLPKRANSLAGPVVVPIDTRRPVRIPAPVAENPQAPPVSPQVLLLQPKGSRAWALAVLVLALAFGAWGYATGFFRTDPEIVSEIEGKFEQDSGLHGRALSAKSAEHIVTIAGMVDNPVQHTAATQQASGVRGVRQLVDQIQVGAPVAAKPKIVVVPQAVQPTTVNATLSIFKSAAAGQGHPNQAHPNVQKRGPAPEAQNQKKPGLLHRLFGKKDKKDTQNNATH